MKLQVKIVTGDDGICRAYCPALPGCAVCAGSPEAALKKITEAVRGYFSSLNATVPDELVTTVTAATSHAERAIAGRLAAAS